MARKIAIVNGRGNVGKSTTAAMLAKCLAHQQKKILLIGLDPLTDFHSQYFEYDILQKQKGEKKTPELKTTDRWKDKGLETKRSLEGIDVLSEGIDLIGFEVWGIKQPRREFLLADKLEKMQDHYDYVLIDTPSSLGLLTMNALVAVQEILIPIRCDHQIFDGMAELFRTITDVQHTLNEKLEVSGFVITHVNKGLRSTSLNLHDIRVCYGEKVMKTEIEESEDLLPFYNELRKELFE